MRRKMDTSTPNRFCTYINFNQSTLRMDGCVKNIHTPFWNDCIDNPLFICVTNFHSKVCFWFWESNARFVAIIVVPTLVASYLIIISSRILIINLDFEEESSLWFKDLIISFVAPHSPQHSGCCAVQGRDWCKYIYKIILVPLVAPYLSYYDFRLKMFRRAQIHLIFFEIS